MKAAMFVSLLLAACGALLLPVLPRFKAGYEHVRIQPSANDYWIEYDEERGGVLRYPSGASWPLPNYEGEFGRLWRLHPKGIDQTFLILRHCLGTYYARCLVWHARSETDLVLVADFEAVGEMLGDTVAEILRLMFEDVDGDGVEELRKADRDAVRDAKKDELDGWAIRTVYHQWNGSAFVPKWTRLLAFDILGPLTPMD